MVCSQAREEMNQEKSLQVPGSGYGFDFVPLGRSLLNLMPHFSRLSGMEWLPGSQALGLVPLSFIWDDSF